MQARVLGTTGVKIPIIGQGTWQMEPDPVPAVAALRRGLDLGLNHIDTAEMYGGGKVETLVSEAIAGRRDRVFLVSKVLPENASLAGAVRACEASLRRLKTDHLDLYLLHWRGSHPLAETFRAFEQLKADGKVRAWGVSNFDVDDMEEAVAAAPAGALACNQVLYHLGARAIEHRLAPWCAQRGIAVVGYSPYGQGRFPEAKSPGGRVLAELAAARGVTPRQVALAFLVRLPGTFAIPKSAQVAHVEENAGAGDLALSDAEMARIDEAFPRGRPRALPTL